MCDHRDLRRLHLPILDQLIPLYLTACTVEGKTDRTVQSYAETLRQFQGAVRELGLPENRI